MTGIGLNQNLRTTLRVIAVVVGLMACVVPQIALGQIPFHASSGAVSGEPSVESAGKGFGAQFTAGHIAGHTVGRTESVSHIGLMPFVRVEDNMFFMDSRLARANRGGLAWSFGGGARHYFADTDTILGINGFYDKDEISGASFEQWGAGAELLGPVWDLRGNWYNPFGTNDTLLGTAAVANSATFVGNSLQFDQVRTLASAFQGFDAEAGALLPGEFADRYQVRGFGGGYWYDGGGSADISGWKARLEARPFEVLELGLQVSDDNFFNTNVTFNAAIHFGGYRRGTSDTRRSTFDRITQRVKRNQTMVTAVRGEVDAALTAINPDTGVAYSIAHVNSAAGGPFIGTVDDPFANIQQAQLTAPDIVYVHANSVFDSSPNNAITVADNQRILGEGFIDGLVSDRIIAPTINVDGIGDIVLPSSPTFMADSAALRPMIANSLAASAVTLGNNSEFSGFIIQDAANIGISAIGSDDGLLRDNDIINAGGDGIFLQNTTGSFSFVDTAVVNAAGAGLHVDGGTAQIRYTATSGDEDPAYGRIANTAGAAVLLENTTGGFLNMSTSTLDDDGGEGIIVRNAAGDATFDNVLTTNSTTNGILIDSSSGLFTFRNTIRNNTTIDGAALEALSITGLAAGGQVNFGDLQIDNRMSTGISMTDIAGTVRFNEDVDIGAQTAGIASAGVAFTNAEATGSVIFGDDLRIGASLGNGILITGNQVNPAAPAVDAVDVPAVISRSSFSVTGTTSVDSATAESILITNDDAAVSFDGITITNRLSRGFVVDNSRGSIDLMGATIINNENTLSSIAMDVQNSPATMDVESLTITNGFDNLGTAAGLLVSNNISNSQGTATKTFDLININTVGGTAVVGRDNSSLIISDGTITATAGGAIDLDNSTLFAAATIDTIDDFSTQVQLESVNSTGAVDGIRLFDLGRTSEFIVTADTSLVLPAASGGTISGATNAGVNMQNAAQVSLTGMLLDNNQNGIIVNNTRLDLDNPDVFNDDLLELLFTRVTASNQFGLIATDLMALNITDSQFDLNGDDAALGRESIFLQYNTLLNDDDTTEFDDFDNPFVVQIVRSMIVDNTDDSIVIANATSANGAHLDLFLDSNTIQNADTSDPDGTDLIDDSLILTWNGPVRGQLLNNAFSLNGGGQDAIDLTATSTTDLFAFNVFNNSITSTVGADRGISVATSGQSFFNIQNNVIDMTGGAGQGFIFQMAAISDITISNNIFTERTDQGRGIVFNSLIAPSTVAMEGNVITLADQLGGAEVGILFQSVAGVVNLDGGTANIVQLGAGSVNGFIETIFSMPAGTNNGQINVNGFAVP